MGKEPDATQKTEEGSAEEQLTDSQESISNENAESSVAKKVLDGYKKLKQTNNTQNSSSESADEKAEHINKTKESFTKRFNKSMPQRSNSLNGALLALWGIGLILSICFRNPMGYKVLFVAVILSLLSEII